MKYAIEIQNHQGYECTTVFMFDNVDARYAGQLNASGNWTNINAVEAKKYISQGFKVWKGKWDASEPRKITYMQ